MRIGRRKVIAAIALLLVAALAFTGWRLWGTDGLLAATLLTFFGALMALGWLVAQSERRVRNLLFDLRQAQSAVGDRDRKSIENAIAAAGQSGEQAEQLLRAVQSGFMRAEHTLDALTSEWHQAREDMLTSVIRTIEREVDIVGREVGLVGREMNIASTNVESALSRVSTLAQTSERALEQMHSAVKTEVTEQNSLLYRQLEALGALYFAVGPKTGMPPTRFWAASPDLLRTLYELIRERKPGLVLECGSGVSTLVMAYAVKQNGTGRVVSLEHLESFKSLTERLVAQHEVDDWVELVHAPLRSLDIDGKEWMWYSTDEIPSEEIDILFVDGPPSSVGPKSRYPAVAAIGDRLAADAVVVLDDYMRKDESQIGELWMAERPDWSLAVIGHEKGTAMFGKNPPLGDATHVTLRHEV
jgi:predicted O-methyltransferase YrrM